jgi:hypothetical protein
LSLPGQGYQKYTINGLKASVSDGYDTLLSEIKDERYREFGAYMCRLNGVE